MTNTQKVFICVLCSIEQMIVLIGTAWLVGWHGWSPSWFAFAMLLISCASPTMLIKMLEKGGSS